MIKFYIFYFHKQLIIFSEVKKGLSRFVMVIFLLTSILCISANQANAQLCTEESITIGTGKIPTEAPLGQGFTACATGGLSKIRVLGYWAFKQFGDKGTVLTPIYDGGYHLQSAFRQGAEMAGASEMDFKVLNYLPEGSQVKGRIQEVFSQIRTEKPSFIYALFCGNEALEFYDEFYKSGLKNEIPLIVSAHMASDEVLKQVSNLDLKFYSASMWNYNSQEKVNLLFKKRVADFAGQKPDFYTLLGYETGLLLEKLIPEFQKRDWPEIRKRLKTETIEGPRGIRSFFLNSEYATPVIYIEKIGFHSNQVTKIVIEQGSALKYDHKTYEKIHKENVSGWQNPYLCI